MKPLIKIALASICLASGLTASASYPVVCSAFDERGDSVTVTLAEQKLTLQITRASGGSLPLSTSASEGGLQGCRAFFDKNSRYMAVGLSHLGLTAGPLRIIVVDLRTGKIGGDFTVPNAALGASLKLAGFFRDKSTLVVLGSGAPDHPTKAFSTALFKVTGEQEDSPETRSLPAGAGSVGNASFADAAHNRLWFKSSPQFCPLRSVPLVGGGADEARVDEANAQAACDVESAIAYPDVNSLVTATTREPDDLITSVDFATHSAQQIALAQIGGHGSYTSVGTGTLSPDGQFFAVSRSLLSNSVLGDAHSRGTEVDIVRVSPLKFIGKVRLEPNVDPASLSIDHRNGTVTVLSFQTGKWSSQLLKEP
ncbi:MAG: hypothetical protein ABI197_00335 [Granulicella sp.]